MPIDFDTSVESEPEENPVEDGDVVKNINEIFRHQFHQIHRESASLRKKYITHAAASTDFTKIAIGLGNEMQVYDVSSSGLSKYVGKNEFGIFDHTSSGVRFLHDDPNVILASTIAGEIHMYDLRTFSKIHTFEGKHFQVRSLL